MKTDVTRNVSSPAIHRVRFASAIALGMTAACCAGAAQLGTLTIQPAKSDLGQVFQLSWDSVPDTLYRVQRSTDLGNNQNWFFGDAVLADSTNAHVEIHAGSSTEFFRLEAHSEIFSLEPAWVDSSDSNSVLYILGQCLPTNASVVINGHTFTVSVVNTAGVWGIVSLNGLPPGEPVIGTISVIDNGTSNVVATYKLEAGFIYATQAPPQQLQGPPEEPPASPLGSMLLPALGSVQEKAKVSAARVTPPKFADITVEAKKAAEKADVGAIRAGIMNRLSDGAEVVPATGEFQQRILDFEIPGRGLDFVWARTYRSRTGPATVQGHGWDFSYNVSLTQQSDGTVLLRPGNGRADTFYPNGTNGWSRDEYFVEVRDLNSDGMPDVLFADTGRWLFNPSGSGASGKLWKIVDRNGNTMRCEYDDLTGLLMRVVDTLDRTNVIAYDAASGLLESVTDFSGRMVRYEYDGNGDLTACVSPAVTGTPTGNDFPGGKTNRYTYTSGFTDERLNHNLASCTDAKGQTWLQVAYQSATNPASLDFDAVDYVQRGPYHEYLRRYPQTPSPSNQFAVVKCISSDAVGNVTECFFDSRLRCVRALEYTGRSNPDLPVTESSNRPTGKLRSTDPDYFETRWKWNPDSLCTLETLPRGDRTRLVYERDFNSSASPRKKGGLRVLRELSCCGDVDLDGDGVADTGDLAWHFEYDPNLGSPASGASARKAKTSEATINVKKIYDSARHGNIWVQEPDGGAYQRNGWDGTIKGFYQDRYAREAFLSTAQSARSLVKHGRRLGYEPDPGLAAEGLEDWAIFNGSQWEKVDNTEDFAMPAPGQRKRGKQYRRVLLQQGRAFPTTTTDPRGSVTTSSYDTQGNRVRVNINPREVGDGFTSDFAYNSHGQLTGITNAADANGYRRVDRMSYYTNGPMNGYLQFVVRDSESDPVDVVLQWDARGNVTNLVDPRGNDWKFHHNALNQCVRVETPTNITERCITDFIYDANDNLVQCTTELRDETDAFLRGHVVAIGHDFLDRVVSIGEQVSTNHFVTNRFDYDGNGSLTAVHSPLAVGGADPNNIVTNIYDERGFLWKQIRGPSLPLEFTTEYAYDPNGRVKSRTTPSDGLTPARTAFNYDGFGRPASITDPMSNVVTYAYDRNDNLVFARVDGELNDGPGSAGNRRLSECRWKYDALDQCVEARAAFFDPLTQSPIGDSASVTSFTYAPNGQCLSATDDNGHTTRYAYDTSGRLAQTTDPKTNVLQVTYDSGDNVTSLVSIEKSDLTAPEQRFTRSYAYDSQSRRVRTVDNVGNTNRYAYDSLHRVVRATDPNGNATFFSYDDLGRRTLAVADFNRDGIADLVVDVNRSWIYDDNSRCVSSTDDNTNTTFYAYDSFDRCVSVTEADGTSFSRVFLSRGSPIRRHYANGTVITNIYDLLERLVGRDIAPGPTVAGTTTYERFAYDGLSRLVAATNDVSHSEFEYNSLGDCHGNHTDGWNMLSAYDGVGNRLSMTYPSGRVVTYTYNPLDEVSTVSTRLVDGAPPVIIATFAYEGPGRLGRITRTNGVNTRIAWDGLVSPPNGAGDFGWRQVSGVNHQVSGGGAVIDRRVSSYDRNQNRTLRAQTVPFVQAGPMQTNIFTYDPLDRLTNSLTALTTTVEQTYQLDGSGNRMAVISNSVAQPYFRDNTPPPGPADFQMDQYTLTPFGTQTYDENGNLISRASSAAQLQYQYDYADRLVAVNDLSSGMPEPLLSFTYDALGRRISKTTYPPMPLAPETIQVIHYGDMIIEVRGELGALQAAFVLDGSRSHDDEVVRLSRPAYLNFTCTFMSRGGQNYFYHSDDLGNVLALTDGSGNVVERYDYQDYGEPSFLASDGTAMGTNASPAGNPFLFHGIEWDGETGLYLESSFEKGWPCRYEGPRYFDAKTGRWVVRSTEAGAGRLSGGRQTGQNGRSFAGDNPWSGKSKPPRCFGAYQPHPQSRTALTGYFEHGDKPTASQFGSLIDSALNFVDDRGLLGLRFGAVVYKGTWDVGGDRQIWNKIKRDLTVEMERRSGGF